MNGDRPKCRFCAAGSEFQKIKGEYVYGAPDNYHFYICDKCEMVYLYPLMTEEQEKEFYAKEFEGFMHNRSGAEMDWSGPEAHVKSSRRERDRRELILPMDQMKGKRVLEIGCSSGFLLSHLKENGAEVVGIEPSGLFSKFVTQQKINVYSDLMDLSSAHERQFDFAIHYYVLEHIREPELFLRSIMEHLKPGGCMIFEVPCVSDPLVALYNVPAFDKFYWSFAHHWYFSKKTLGLLLDRVGSRYKLFPEQRYDLSNHMWWMLKGKPGGMGKFSEVFSKETEEAYKKDLKHAWLCDTIVAKVFKD